MLVEILLIIIMIIVYFILYELATMSPLGWHLPNLVDNTDTLSGGRTLTIDSVGFFRFLLFCVHEFAFAPVSLCVCVPVFNTSQIFKNSLLWSSEWPSNQKMIKVQW